MNRPKHRPNLGTRTFRGRQPFKPFAIVAMLQRAKRTRAWQRKPVVRASRDSGCYTARDRVFIARDANPAWKNPNGRYSRLRRLLHAAAWQGKRQAGW